MTNLLFITLDDFLALSAWPIYRDVAITPNMDAFAQANTNFNAAFADVALCNPSRAAILTGKNPWDTGVINNAQDLRHHVDVGTETLPGILKAAGHYTVLGGKVFHTFPMAEADAVADLRLDSAGLRNSAAADFNAVDDINYGTTDDVLSDDTLVDSAAAFLASHDPDTPFALFAGVYRPHADWIIPQAYLDLYADVDIPLPDFVDDADRADFLSALQRPFHEEVLASGAWEDLVRHYLASLSYADAKLGDVLDALNSSGHADNTVSVVMSDHGYHLGDADMWHKFSTYEQSARAPFIVSVPGGTAQQIDAPVNLSAAAATVLELLGLDVPADMQPSLVPLMDGAPATGDEYALTWMNGSVSVRTEHYRYTLFENGEEELFDIDADVMNTDNRITDLPEIAETLRALAQDAIGDDLFIRPTDAVTGSAQDTVYYLHRTPVAITDLGGTDTVYIAHDYTLPDGLENLHSVDGIAGYTFTGNAADNRMSGSQSNDTLIGLAGADRIFGGGGNDIVMGGLGDDDLGGGNGNDTLYGDAGDDWIEGDFGTDILFGGAGHDMLDGGEGHDTLSGDAGADTLTGSAGNDHLFGGAGDDTLYGGLGWDLLNGGAGTDTALFDGLSRDYCLISNDGFRFRIKADAGIDIVRGIEWLRFDDGLFSVAQFLATTDAVERIGTAADDLFQTAGGDDHLDGRDGADVLLSYGGDDLLVGGRGADRLDGGIGQDTASYLSALGAVEVYLNFGLARGADGKDRLENIEHVMGGLHGDRLVGDAGSNTLTGKDGDDILMGHDGADHLISGRGNDRIEGGAGDDLIQAGTGADWISAGDGADYISAGNDNDTVRADAGDDIVDGGAGHDRIFGGAGADTLLGETGDDQLYGGAGDDLLIGGLGQDRLDGDTGQDTADYSAATAAIEAYLDFELARGASGRDTLIEIENLIGSAYDDRLSGDDADNVLNGAGGADILKGHGGDDHLVAGDGDDTLFGGSGSDRLDAGAGDDLLFAGSGDDTSLAGDGDDTIYGNHGDDRLEGGAGADTLFGGSHQDVLLGGADHDSLHGDAGRDFLYGGDGSDTLRGGAGDDVLFGGAAGGTGDGARDVFIFAPASLGSGGFDVIRDFEDGLDQIDLTAFGFTDFATDIQPLAELRGADDLALVFGGGDVLYIAQLALSDFGASDVLL